MPEPPAAGSALTPIESLSSGTYSRLLLCSAGEKPVLVKATRLEPSRPEAARRAAREILITMQAGELKTAFVLQSFGWMKAAGEVFNILEYLPGGDVGLLIDRAGALSPSAARFYCGCVALGLESLHKLDWFHRDVKPENFCLARDGYAKLCDLGFARKLPEDGRAQTLLGTPEYLAPEVRGRLAAATL